MNNGITVVIRAKNEAEWIGSCLGAVGLQDYADVEVIVVDNNSTDSTREIVERHGYNIVNISDADFNFSRALNLGIRVSPSSLWFPATASLPMING